MRPCSLCTPISLLSLLPTSLTHPPCCSSLRAPSSSTLPFLLPATPSWLAPPVPSYLCSVVIFSVTPSFFSCPPQNSNSSLSTIFPIPSPCFIFLCSAHRHLTNCMFYLLSPSLQYQLPKARDFVSLFTAPFPAPRTVSSTW